MNDRDIIGYCLYCKDPIYDGDAYVFLNDNKYHTDCYNQMNTYYNPYEDFD